MTGDIAPWRLPAEFNEYRIVRPLGNGSMGQVYLAQDLLLDRPVAVKLIAGGSPDAAQRERFQVEARAIARVQHPNVVEIYRAGEVQGRPYLVSEYVRGQSLDQLPLPLPWERVLGIAIDLASGLAAAHRRSVLHRDIKPANVMVTDEGELKLLDFGVAKLIDVAGGVPGPSAVASSSRRTLSSGDSTVDAARRVTSPPPQRAAASADLAHATGLVGTPRYMAPEAWRQEPATPRSDLYSLGVVLYELCTGTIPHSATSLGALRDAVLEQDAVPLAQRAVGVNPAFAALVDRCLSRDPDLRFASGDALREALEALRGGREQVGMRERPYPGLHAFRSEDRSTFFGRDAQVRAVVDRLRGEALVLVAGDSGAGKSSLCRAGVLPRVIEGTLGQGGAWVACEMLPGKHPLQALAVALAPLRDGASHAELSGLLTRSPWEVGRWAIAQAQSRGVLVFVDQLEELLTLAAPEELEPFVTALRSLTACGPRLRVLATIRGDFLARLAELPGGLGESLGSGLYLLPHLAESGLREAVTGPARSQGYTFESEALTDALVAAGSAEGGLPLLQFALAELWERRDRVRRVIPAEALEALGGVEGALAHHGDGVLAALRPGPRAAARRLLLRLVLADGTRARRARAELLGEGGSEDAEARMALEALVRGRLVIGSESPDGTATYELAHEALVRGWDTLRAWLANDQEQRAIRQRLERACAEWERLGRPREQLWKGRQLAEVTQLDERALPAREQGFLHASRRAARQRRLLGMGAALMVPFTAAAVYGGLQLRAWQARESEVAEAVADTGRAVGLAAARSQRVDELRRVSFSSFDAWRRDEAERTWAEAVRLGKEETQAYDEAIAILDRAIARNGSRQELRHHLAEALYRYLLSAERDHREPVRAFLLRRLEAIDDAHEYRERLLAPALLEIETEPSEAEMQVEQAVEVGDDQPKKMRWVPLPRPAGKTPISGMRLRPGSYRLRLERPDRPPVLYPILLQRGERYRVRIPMPNSIPEGYVYVAPGRFLYGSADDEPLRLELATVPPIHPVSTEGFLIARHEVTYGDWIAFLRTLSPAERIQRRPHDGNYATTIRLDEARDGRWTLVMVRGSHPYRAREGDRFVYLQRDRRVDQDWLRFPVSSISWEDARAYLAWLDRSGRPRGARFCSELEWERAARGADGREFPHGNRLDPEDANFDLTYGRNELAFGPDEVGSHPASDSPFGVSDMAGNIWELMTTGRPDQPVAFGGGGFYQGRRSSRSLNHDEALPTTRWPFQGLRVCAAAPLP